MDDLRAQRIEKLNQMMQMGLNPFAYSYHRSHFAQAVLDEYAKKDGFEGEVSLAGRLMSLRRMGKASFGHIMDSTGRIQIYVKQDQVGEDAYAAFKLLDLGDFIGVKGEIFATKTGEVTVLVRSLEVLAKTIRPLPVVKEKTDGDDKVVFDRFADKELRYRQRYVDLVVNPDVREVFIQRSGIVSSMRHYLEKRGYLEVETPALQPLYGGAFARPFITHHNALDMALYLRIADELYLKRLIVGGFDGVFEIAKDFRNEGMDRDHNPEFTMMELYVAYQDYHFMMDLVEDMVSSITAEVTGGMTVQTHGEKLDLKPPWKRVSFFDALQEYTGHDLYQKDLQTLKKTADALHVEPDENADTMQIIDEIFSTYVEPKLIQPTFIIDYPLELSPLAKKHRSKPGLVERFEGYMLGMEICNAFSELNDPVDQQERFEQQARLRAEGNEEAMVIDEDYIRAMEYGMPPTAGLGLGVDRLCMILTDSPSIRDVILFPHMRPETPAP